MITINSHSNPNVCQTIKANYYKVSFANLTGGGQRYSAPGVIECKQDGNFKPEELEEWMSEKTRLEQ